jgi:undecaprenyl-diphosphatase
MPVIHAIILGIIQGITEPIPVSSSGHLIAIPQLLGWKDFGLTFDVALHMGTVIAVVAFFWKDWVSILGGLVQNLSKRKDAPTPEGKLFVPIIIACIPAGIAGLIWSDTIDKNLRHWYLVGGALIVVSIIMLIAERVAKRNRDINSMSYLDYIVIGLAQAVALFPGVSRSGSTITAGLFLNLDRQAAARFSFLLSTPIILAAGVFKLRHVFPMPSGEAAPFAVGVATSAVVGYLAIGFLMRFLQKHSLAVFAVYRIAFALAMGIVFAVKGM